MQTIAIDETTRQIREILETNAFEELQALIAELHERVFESADGSHYRLLQNQTECARRAAAVKPFAGRVSDFDYEKMFFEYTGPAFFRNLVLWAFKDGEDRDDEDSQGRHAAVFFWALLRDIGKAREDILSSRS